jgi:hypothetical protein
VNQCVSPGAGENGADESKQFVQTGKRTKPQNAVETSQIITQTPDTVMSDETKTKVARLFDSLSINNIQIMNGFRCLF